MFCRICGASIPEDSIFCPQCGTKISSSFTKEVIKTESEIRITEEKVEETEEILPIVELYQAPIWRRAIASLIDKVGCSGGGSNGLFIVVALTQSANTAVAQIKKNFKPLFFI